MAMNIFEDHISELKDIPRIISETIQLENYIFNKPPKEKELTERKTDVV